MPRGRDASARWSTVQVFAAVTGLALQAGAQTPAPTGAQFQVNTYTTNAQHDASVAVEADGDFVVVWQSLGSSGGDTSADSIQGQRYASSGAAQGGQFQVNTYTTNIQSLPAVAMALDGRFVVVWESNGSSGGDTSSTSIQGRFYTSAGVPGAQFQVNSYTTGAQNGAVVAAADNGDFVVTWQSNGSPGTDTNLSSIQARRYATGGTPQGTQFQVNSYTTGAQTVPSVAVDSDRDFIVAWDSEGSSGTDTSASSVQAQRYNAAGSAQGAQFQVNTYTTNDQFQPSVAAASNGDFVVAWTSYDYGSYDGVIEARRYDAAGVPKGTPFEVSSQGTSFSFPSVDAEPGGHFVLAWNQGAVVARSYASDGSQQGSEFLVSSPSTGFSERPAAAVESDGDFVLAWNSNVPGGTDTSSHSVQARRYAMSGGAGDVPFGSSDNIHTFFEPLQQPAPADMDGDGDLDVLVKPMLWFENTSGDGSSWGPNGHLVGSFNPEYQIPADVDADGDLDVVAGRWDSPYTLVWFENLGAGTSFAPALTIASGVGHPLAAADFDRDGDLDIAYVLNGGTALYWAANNGDGSSWTAAHPVGGGGSSPWDRLVAVDLDRDGDVDVAASQGGSNDRVVWFENDGSGTFAALQPIGAGLDEVVGLLAADLDGDGDLDVASAAGGNGDLDWFENTSGDASSWSAHGIATNDPPPTDLAAGDLDLDGDVDLLLAVFSATKIFDNASGDASVWAHGGEFAFGESGELAIADFERDGDPDVVHVDGTGSGRLLWTANRMIHRSGAFAAKMTIDASADIPIWVSAADIDRDGDQDALIINVGASGGIRWRENLDGAGSFGPANLITSANHARVIRVGDLDRDGDPDLVTAASGAPGLVWIENNALSWTTHAIAPGYAFPYHADIGDVDRDGDLDVIASSSEDGNASLAWFENDAGDASDWSEHTIAFTQAFPTDVRLADVDGNGDLDAFYTENGYATIAWKENTAGDGSAWSDHIIENGLSTIVPNAVEPVDMDRDGDFDVVVASRGSNNSAWFANANGVGTAWTRHSLGSPAKLFWLRASDLDRDGDLDVVGSGEEADDLYVFENNAGDASAWSVDALGAGIDQPFGLDTADLDGDGDDDLLAVGFADQDVVSFRNEGGQFALPTQAVHHLGMVQGFMRQVLKIAPSHRGRTGDSIAELTSLSLMFTSSSGVPLTSPQATALFSLIQIRSGSATGPVVATALSPFTLTGGILTIPFSDADPDVQVEATQSLPLYVTPMIAGGAPSASPNQFRIGHIVAGIGSSSAQDAATDLSLTLETAGGNVFTDTITALVQLGDADGDGLSNVNEAGLYFTDPLVVDTDGDGLSDGAEVITYFSNPLDTDSDDDGLDDGEEVEITTDPNDPDSDADGYCDGPSSPPGGCTAGDNCPAIANGAQTNGDAFAAGDACQCGDATGDGTITPIDYTRAREYVAGRTPSGAFQLDRCDVTGDAQCDVADLAVLDRLVNGAPAELRNRCEAYTGP